MKRTLFLTLGVFATVSFAAADLTVDQSLGMLGASSSTNLTGSTIGGNTNADFYPPTSFTEVLGEYVYSFSVSGLTIASIHNNEGIFVGSDNDHFLLNSLSTTFDGTNNIATGAIGFVDEDGSFGVALHPGNTYYLSVDTYGLSTEGPYDIDLNMSAPPPPPPSTYLGVAGVDGDSIDMNTFGSGFDTELGLFNELGGLIASNDDVGGLQSQIISTLAEGTYYLALGGFNTSYGSGFSATGGSANGSYTLSVTNTAGAAGTLAAGEHHWYSFDIVPEPSSLLLLIAGSLLVTRRR